MKKLSFLIIAVIVLVIHACTEKQEVVEQTHEDGTPKTVVTYLVENDQKIKLSTKQFYKNGQLELQGDFDKDGKRHGAWIYNYKTGTRWSEAEYEHGLRQGESAVYYENGKLRYKGKYKEDKTIGKWFFYDEKGNLVKELMYQVGIWF